MRRLRSEYIEISFSPFSPTPVPFTTLDRKHEGVVNYAGKRTKRSRYVIERLRSSVTNSTIKRSYKCTTLCTRLLKTRHSIASSSLFPGTNNLLLPIDKDSLSIFFILSPFSFLYHLKGVLDKHCTDEF